MNRGQKEAYRRDYAQAKAEGKPFFPYAVYKDLLIGGLAIAIVIGLAIAARVEVGEPVNPATTDFVPRPEWYFFFLFELLRFFEGENVFTPVIMATFIIPNIFMVLLILWPFIDRGPERRPHRRPLSMVTGVIVIAFLGYTTVLGSEAPGGLSEDVEFANLTPEAQAGLMVFQNAGCSGCHAIGPTGPNIGPSLAEYGTRAGSIEDTIAILNDGPAIMPSFQDLPMEDKLAVANFVNGLGTEYSPGG